MFLEALLILELLANRPSTKDKQVLWSPLAEAMSPPMSPLCP